MNACRIPPRQFPDPVIDTPLSAASEEKSIVMAGGCFWCTEAVFRQLRGVRSVVSGYAGGSASTANYRAVCGGNTGHAEAIEIKYDASQCTLGQLLKIFFSIAHDPTQLDGQGADIGTQYRSAIFFADGVDGEQRRVSEAYIKQLNAAGVFSKPIVTTLEPLEAFYPAEDYHQNYAALNPAQPYIAGVSAPKVAKLRENFSDKLKG
jgi:peptide-methionine (S)-S-oxide reductase